MTRMQNILATLATIAIVGGLGCIFFDRGLLAAILLVGGGGTLAAVLPRGGDTAGTNGASDSN